MEEALNCPADKMTEPGPLSVVTTKPAQWTHKHSATRLMKAQHQGLLLPQADLVGLLLTGALAQGLTVSLVLLTHSQNSTAV